MSKPGKSLSLADLAQDNFESCMKVGKLGLNFVKKWQAEVQDHEARKILRLEGDLLDKEDKLCYVRDTLLVETWEERDQYKKERHEAMKKPEALGSIIHIQHRWLLQCSWDGMLIDPSGERSAPVWFEMVV